MNRRRKARGKRSPARGSDAAPFLPTDCMNARRAVWAEEALIAFGDVVGLNVDAEYSEALHDLLCNLGHYADRKGLDFPTQIRAALATWREEKADPAENGQWE